MEREKPLTAILMLHERNLRISRMISLAITAFSILVGVSLVAIATVTTAWYIDAQKEISDLQSKIDELTENANRPAASSRSSGSQPKKTASPTPATVTNTETERTPCPEGTTSVTGTSNQDLTEGLEKIIQDLGRKLEDCKKSSQNKQKRLPVTDVINPNAEVKTP